MAVGTAPLYHPLYKRAWGALWVDERGEMELGVFFSCLPSFTSITNEHLASYSRSPERHPKQQILSWLGPLGCGRREAGCSGPRIPDKRMAGAARHLLEPQCPGCLFSPAARGPAAAGELEAMAQVPAAAGLGCGGGALLSSALRAAAACTAWTTCHHRHTPRGTASHAYGPPAQAPRRGLRFVYVGHLLTRERPRQHSFSWCCHWSTVNARHRHDFHHCRLGHANSKRLPCWPRCLLTVQLEQAARTYWPGLTKALW